MSAIGRLLPRTLRKIGPRISEETPGRRTFFQGTAHVRHCSGLVVADCTRPTSNDAAANRSSEAKSSRDRESTTGDIVRRRYCQVK